VFNPATVYWLDDWTFDVEVYAQARLGGSGPRA